MSYRSELSSYVARLQQRLRLSAWLRGAAVFTGTALMVTLALIFALNLLAFPERGVSLARLVIFATLAAAAALGIVLPLKKLTRARAVRMAEAAGPELEQRLTTFEERAGAGGHKDDLFLELLAADTLARTEEIQPGMLVPRNRLFALGGVGFACVTVLVWMIAAGPGYVGYGASLLWTGPKKDTAPLYAIAVTPGNATVRRNSDQLITAHVTGMAPSRAQLFAHYQSAAGWEPVAMQAAPDASGGASYQFVLAGLPENVEYYVAAGPLTSEHYKVRVVDLPSVKEIRVTYHYPKWTGMKPVTEEHAGDLRAIEGTNATIELQMDKPLREGQLLLDNGKTIALTGGAGNRYQASIPMEKDGAYHVAATDEGQSVRLSEDYFIATDKAMPPEIAIQRPGGDYRASPIEEVTVGVKAADQFGLSDVHLHYSVNGGADRDVNLLKAPGVKDADGSYTLLLEDFKLVPGDLVSLYATAKDGHSEARTDISFIQVDPFEREFSQSQQAGGGGGGGSGGANNQTEISKREKELIAATWKQQNDKTATPKDQAAQGQFLSDAQQKLRDQVTALSVRMQSRDISSANEEFTDFDKDMQDAAKAMAPSADKLRATQWKDAVPLEQKALQALLRAEATFRRIEVAFGQRGGGGGGGGSTGRDLASLFDLELDTEKNQYETAQTASPAEQHEKDVEDALEKLDALARREEDLANQQRNPQQSFEQRWQQEMLRREAEQLQRQMEQMAQNGQGGQQSQQEQQSSNSGASASSSSSSSGQSSSQNQSSAQASRGQAGGQSSRSNSASNENSDQPIEQALSRLKQATGTMQRGGNGQQSADAAQQAAEKLREATNMLAGSQQQLASGKMDSLAREAERLRQDEHAQSDRINKLANHQNDTEKAATTTDLDSVMARLHERDQLAAERQQLSNDLSRLQKNLRDAARGMASNEPGTAQKLRDALTEMDNSDLDNRVQRTADWLRSGVNPNANGTEGEIAQGLGKLSQQLQQAQQAMEREDSGQGPGRDRGHDRGLGRGQNRGAQGDESAALDQVERLRNQIEAMTRARNGDSDGFRQNGQGRDGQNGQRTGQQPGTGGQLGRGGQPGNANGQGGQQGWAFAQPLNRSGQAQTGGAPGGPQNGQRGDVRNGFSGDTRSGGGGANGTVWGNYDTGNNTPRLRGRSQTAPNDASGNPADTERTYQQSLRALNQLRQITGSDPQAAKDIAELTRQMQHLDPSRFPGNPAMVEQMHREVLSSVDRIELELERSGSTDARTGKPYAIPAGYQDSVADYYRRLSKNPQ
ncbi:MAG TPA: hypothetical protein VFB43_15450 [Terracidiphilus sp.]|nr:hypothetical protein [Terracidiphilus sp.]